MQDPQSAATAAVVGVLTGVFDLINVADLDVIAQARSLCDRLELVVVDDASLARSGRAAIIPDHERLLIVEAVRGVDAGSLADADAGADWREMPLRLTASDSSVATHLLRPRRLTRSVELARTLHALDESVA